MIKFGRNTEFSLLLMDMIIFSFLFFITSVISLYLSKLPHLTILWISNVVGVALLLRHSVRDWPLPIILMGIINFLCYEFFGNGISISVYYTIINLIEILLTTFIILRYQLLNDFDKKIKSGIILFITACFIAPFTRTVLLLCAFGFTGTLQNWINYLVGDGVCMMIFLPVVLCFLRGRWRELTLYKLFGVIILLFITGCLTYLSLLYLPYSFILLLMPLLIVAVFNSVFETILIASFNVFLIFSLYNAKLFIPLVTPEFRHIFYIYLPTMLVFLPPYLLSILMYILKKAEKDLEVSENQFRGAMESSGIGMALVTLDGHWFKVNPALCKMLEYSAEELQKKTFQEITYPEDLSLSLNYLEELKQGKVSVYHIDKRYISKSGKIIWVHLSVSLFNRNGAFPRYYVAQIEDITQEKALQRELNYYATHDLLTGLMSRRQFENELRQVLEHERLKKIEHALCYIDLDNFKIVNDSAGHLAGDALLQEIAGLMRSQVRGADILARLGGDEFAILFTHCGLDEAKKIVEELIELINATRFTWKEQIYRVGASAGLVGITDNTYTVDQLLSEADIACYSAKDAGRNRVFVYESGRTEVGEQHRGILLASTLREAVDNNRFVLYAQKIVSTRLENREEKHFEILLRMLGEGSNLVPASDFIPIAERYNLMSSIDRWVLTELLSKMDTTLAKLDDTLFSINISANSLNNPQFLPFLLGLIEKSAIPANRLCFEITETAAMNQIAKTVEIINKLGEIGCKISLDDFGAGFSSFTYLKNFRVTFIKIDGSFIKNVAHHDLDMIIVGSMNEIAHHLGIKTIAESVESEEILKIITGIGVDYAQGDIITRPMPIEKIIGEFN